MLHTIETELKQTIIDSIADYKGCDADDLHDLIFNQNYYIIGYHQCEQWLKTHGLSAFDAIADLIELEEQHLGEFDLPAKCINSETVVNRLVYWYAYEIMPRVESESGLIDDQFIADVIAEPGE